MEKLNSNRYSVLILDLMVPEVDGFKLIDFIRSHEIDVPVAVVSAVSQQALAKLDPAVVKLVIAKPFDVAELTRGILQLCAEGEEAGRRE